MTRNKILAAIMAGVIATGSAGAAGLAYAKESRDTPTNEASIMANSKVTMAQAIATAEQQVGGTAVGTGIEDQDGNVFFEVEVLKGNTTHKVLIDTQTGKVAKSVANNGNDDEHDDD